MSQTYTKIGYFVIVIAMFAACNTIKYVEENEYLLKENKVIVDDKESKSGDLKEYIIQRPNKKTFGVPLQLHIYNFSDPDFVESYPEWIIENEDKHRFYKNVFSEKQTYVIYDTDKRLNNWIKGKGQPPVIYNDIKTKNTINSFKRYFFSQGYFDADVTYEELEPKEKQKEVVYSIEKKDRYFIQSITDDISSGVLDSIYHRSMKNAKIKIGDPFVFTNFEDEEERLFKLFRNSGIFHFQSNNIRFVTDSSRATKEKDVLMVIPDRLVSINDSTYTVPYKIQRIKNVNVYTDFEIANRNLKPKDSAIYNGIKYYANEKLDYNPEHLDEHIFLQPGAIYRDLDVALTRSNIRKLQNFNSTIDIRFRELENNKLEANIYLNPLKKYALTFDVDATTSNIKPFGILGKFSFLDKNTFKGAEIFELSFQGSFLNVSKDASESSNFFNAWEFISKASLTFPRIAFPIESKGIIPKEMSPQTNIDFSFGTQKNIGLDRRTLTTGLSYAWRSNKKLGHKLDLYNLQYIENENVENYFFVYESEYNKLDDVSEVLFDETLEQDNEVILDFMDDVLDPNNGYEQTDPKEYDEVSDVNERRDILIEDVLVPVISYGINYTTKSSIKDQDFIFLTSRLVSSGTLTTILASNSDENGQKVLFGLPIAQYIKAEFEFKKYWKISRGDNLIFRTFIGAAFPFGNSTSVPFSRSYNAGGSNDIRAWRTYDLGPGGEVNNLEFNVGSFKMVTNLEYRFALTNKIYSALFIDAGNIWDITNSNLVSDEGKFDSFEDLKNTAIGSGIGLRYDFGFLVFRFDTGFKTYEPYLQGSDKWFSNYNFSNATYNIGINYPF